MTVRDVPTRSRAATRERLLDAARTVLAREGIQGASVEHICEQAGFTRGAFYSNFTSKDDLVLALFEREKDRMMATLAEATDPSALAGLDPVSSVAHILDRFAALQPPDREWFLVHSEFELRGIRDDAVGRAFNAAWREVKAQLQDHIAAVLQVLGLRLTISPEHAATILMGTYDAALREALIEDRGLDMDLLRATVPILMLSVTERID